MLCRETCHTSWAYFYFCPICTNARLDSYKLNYVKIETENVFMKTFCLQTSFLSIKLDLFCAAEQY